MMDVSKEVHDVLTLVKLISKDSEESIRSLPRFQRTHYDLKNSNVLDEIIDVNAIDFGNDEVWLYEVPNAHSNIKDLKTWLYQDLVGLKDVDFYTNRLTLVREIAKTDTRKSIDSRTFTRPKKRLNRLSIEMYDGDYFKPNNKLEDSNRHITDAEFVDTSQFMLDESVEDVCNVTQVKRVPLDDNIISERHAHRPLNFDLTQPTVSNIFDNISGHVPELDSFQNMSPPSLVNSLCSSTFANLMESSTIKNDPILREIRDADYTEADLHLPKSFTDSCSSINSDTTEKFLKHTIDTINKSWKKNASQTDISLNDTYTADNTTVLNCTYLKDSSNDMSSSELYNDEKGTVVNATVINIPSVLNGTFRKSVNNSLNATFKKSPETQNNTITVIDRANSDNHRLTKRRSYVLDNRDNDSSQSPSSKRNSFGYSAGSTDSLDMSSLSSSSRGSNKMLNMAEVDAIVHQQEQSLQIMSTPKPSSKIVSKLWQNNGISPITPLIRDDRLSDSEASSNDDYMTVTSSTSNTTTVYGSDTHLSDTYRSNSAPNVPKQSYPRSLQAIPAKVASNKFDNNYKGSHSNLKTVDNHLKGSYTNLKPKGANVMKGSYSNLATTARNMKGSYSNLKTMSNNLKGSYTQLRPTLSNLPCADTNVRMPNVTANLKKNCDGNLKIAEVAPTLRDINKDYARSTSALNCPKTQAKTSGLPRPISGIPRPATSRIPAPRTMRPSNLRPPNRPLSKVNFDGDF